MPRVDKRLVYRAMSAGVRGADAALKRRRAVSLARSRTMPGVQGKPTRKSLEASIGLARLAFTGAAPSGVLVAEGDSWFDYPLNDVLDLLEDVHGYDVESVAHHGDAVEAMAYGAGQLDAFTRRIEKVLRRGSSPKAVLLSGGGNDIAGDEFAMLLDHALSPRPGLNSTVVGGVIDERLFYAYTTILTAVTRICASVAGRPIPILIHGYDFPIPDGRGFMGGWGPLPGPWLEPGLRAKGYGDLVRGTALVRDLIDRFNGMLERVVALRGFSHVHYIDLRGTLDSAPGRHKKLWANELHPSPRGFGLVTDRFAKALRAL